MRPFKAKKNIADKDIADFDQGAEKAPPRRQAERGRLTSALTSLYGNDGDSMMIPRVECVRQHVSASVFGHERAMGLTL